LPVSALASPRLPTGIAEFTITCFSGWHELRQPVILPVFYPSGDRAVMLPAAVLLLAGLGTMLATALQKLRSRPEVS
jgi:hypothetical protein